MNGRKAKALRRLARAHTVGQPDNESVVIQAKRSDGKPAFRLFPTGKTNSDGTPELLPVMSMQRILNPNCTRAKYRRVKRMVKQFRLLALAS